ncbi:hypothetical protein OPIT5_08225 [Opitutaceae bacterium TAV5]|nr:hypothetical protein OPIT5_08225 [Opitutaceae bacterium TAV5]
MSDLFKSTPMTDKNLDGAAQATCALRAVLERIRDVPAVGWHIGLGTETFGKLTEAYATLTSQPVEGIRRAYLPLNATNPRDDK